MLRPAATVNVLVLFLAGVCAAYSPRDLPSSRPHEYPNQPSGDYSPAWQDYFEVKDRLPNVTWDLSRSFAGNIPVGRAHHPDDTLFFWAFEKENGSLTADAGELANAPWGIWLNGGPGASSLVGLAFENGPVHINADFSASQNMYSWDTLADFIWVDQPVGVGFSTADSDGYAEDEDELGSDFMGFLANLVKVFPSLQTRPLYLTGESYAGRYIPYILKAYFGLADPPVTIAGFAIGDGSLGSNILHNNVPVLTMIETYPQLIGYDPAVFEYFREQEHLCGYDLNLTYPQNGHFPTLTRVKGASSVAARSHQQKNGELERRMRAREAIRWAGHAADVGRRDGVAVLGKRDLSERANGVIDPWYGCDLSEEMVEYALNFSAPWNISLNFDTYQIPDALSPKVNKDASVFLNDPQTRAALHAPTNKNWRASISDPFIGGHDSSVEPMAFLTELAANASAQHMSVVLFSGNDDSLVSHRGTEVVIQNTTFGGIQGFTRKPSTPWFDDNGERGGIVHQERNWTYVLVEGAGHMVPYTNPQRAFVVAREFIFGRNQTGLVANAGDAVSAIDGGENAALAADAIPGQMGIYVGSAATQSTFAYPPATVAAWDSFMATATATATAPAVTGSGGAPGTHRNGGTHVAERPGAVFAFVLGAVLMAGSL